MVYAKYTRDILSEAVAASTSMAGVLRHLGIRQTGGAHAHLRRRITKLGIDCSHFLGSAHYRGTHSLNRRPVDQILILRPAAGAREKPRVLRRALEETGRPVRCAECRIGDSWQGRPLVLHVDHIDGRSWDCRPENLRFLCPNCHSQTSTYAGRKRSQSPAALTAVGEDGNPISPLPPPAPLNEEDMLNLLARWKRKEIGASQAATLIGCSRAQVYRLQRRLAERGSVTTAARRPKLSDTARDSVIAFALAHPDLGPRRIADALHDLPEPLTISQSTVSNLLSRAGLSTREKRVSAARKAEEQATV